MKKPNLVSILLLSILFAVVTVSNSIAAAPSGINKFNRCANAKGSTFHPVKNSKGTGEKCCYPRNKTTGKKTCIKCVYPSGGGTPVCTKNQFSQSDRFKNPIIPGGASSELAPPKPLTRVEKLKRGRFNPGSAPSQLAPPKTPAPTPAQRTRDRYMGRQGFAPRAR